MIARQTAQRIAREIAARTEWVIGDMPRGWEGALCVRLMTMGLDEALSRTRKFGWMPMGAEWSHNAYRLAKRLVNEARAADLPPY